MRPKCIVIMGAPGVGKGTYASLLSGWLGYEHVSTGDAIRERIRVGAPEGIRYQKYVEQGELIPDKMIFPLVEQLIDQRSAILMDGFPRQKSQIYFLDSLVDVKMAFLLKLRRDVLIEKIVSRRVCVKCNKIYNLADINYGSMRMPPLAPQVPGVCDHCKSAIVQREDDRIEVVQKRLNEFDKTTEPLVEEYERRGILVPFELTGGKKEMWSVIQRQFKEHGYYPTAETLSKN